MYSLLMLFGVLAGVTTVLFGFGGGFVVVPVLYAMLLSVDGADSTAAMQVAVATSTCVMVFAAGAATLRHHRAATIVWPQIRPLLGYIAIGALLGAIAALTVSASWLRWAFIAYLLVTIADNLLRPGFVTVCRTAHAPGKAGNALIGVLIGAIAAFLGVGGSVMTVALMRRRGASMTAATAMANPLSLPMAVVGTVTYMTLDWSERPLAGWHLGHVDLLASLVLIAGSWLGIRLAAPWIGRIPDRLHAKIYLALLCLVLGVMVVS